MVRLSIRNGDDPGNTLCLGLSARDRLGNEAGEEVDWVVTFDRDASSQEHP
ncbi:hypothetical protein [Cyanobium sp. Cruz CV13-4-11]|jgi:hypothetical protein|uniref:hypothetical protein n=1 Tax=Cyanobium sp. Cruz CV13-4-11 TaxID=2823710 RepID=UPI0020CCAC85|nr:hypothetical protein [Cyanobium sp. Cruz CV13-4-11]MCP9899708.1 hypothetical protein [Cyanobium sp. Cruz CV11-17]